MGIRRISDEMIIKFALEMPASETPFSDLVSHVRQALNCSANVAGKAVGRVVAKELIYQEWHKEKRYHPSQAGNRSSDPYWTMEVATWKRI